TRFSRDWSSDVCSSDLYSYTDSNLEDGIYNYTLKQIDFDGTINVLGSVTAVVDNIPDEFILNQNYPNPFNPYTIIKYNLPEQSKVRLEIVNVLGETVDVLTNEIQDKGSHTKLWDAGNNTSGIYFAILKAESESGKSYSKTIKMSLIR